MMIIPPFKQTYLWLNCYTYFVVKLQRLLNISRPRFWIYELGPYLIGITAAAQGTYSLAYLIPSFLFFLFFTYPANIYIYGINDAYDYETDKLNPKKVSYESLVMPEEQKKLLIHIALVSLPFLLYAFVTLSIAALVAFGAFFFFAGFYSATPIRAKTKPFLDSIFSAGHYIATAAFSYIFLTDLMNRDYSNDALVLCILAGMCWAIAMHAYSAVPDIKADSDAGLKTIATTLQKRGTIVLCAGLYAFSGILSFPYLGIISIILALFYVGFMLMSLRTTDDELFRIYTYFPIINTVSGMIIFFIILFR
jgi:4-hydroxybenzoate polyprenyltransferase